MEKAIGIYTRARGGCTSDAVRRALLAVEIVTHASAGYFPFSRPSRFDFVRMGPDIAAPAVPSANGSEGYGEQKLYGRRLFHFGAFGSREWRQHDFIWGRLDGAAHLVRLLAACTDVPEWTKQGDAQQLKRDRTLAAQQTVLAEERVTAEYVAEQTHKLGTLNSKATLNRLRECPSGQEAIRGVVTDVLRTLLPPKEAGGSEDQPTAPLQAVRSSAPSAAPPRRSVVLGRWASVVLAEPVADGVASTIMPRIVRFLTVCLRRRTWNTILRPSADHNTPRSSR
jgi:hypothetical protein